MYISGLWQYGLWSFQTGGTKLERFLPKNQHTQSKLLNFENWISGGLRSFQKSVFYAYLLTRLQEVLKNLLEKEPNMTLLVFQTVQTVKNEQP